MHFFESFADDYGALKRQKFIFLQPEFLQNKSLNVKKSDYIFVSDIVNLTQNAFIHLNSGRFVENKTSVSVY